MSVVFNFELQNTDCLQSILLVYFVQMYVHVFFMYFNLKLLFSLNLIPGFIL